jgi:hypothetical protein
VALTHGKRQHLGSIKHFERGGHHLDFAGGDLGIVRAVGTLANFAGYRHHPFAAQLLGAFEKFRRQIRWIKNGLCASFPITHVNED